MAFAITNNGIVIAQGFLRHTVPKYNNCAGIARSWLKGKKRDRSKPLYRKVFQSDMISLVLHATDSAENKIAETDIVLSFATVATQ